MLDRCLACLVFVGLNTPLHPPHHHPLSVARLTNPWTNAGTARPTNHSINPCRAEIPPTSSDPEDNRHGVWLSRSLAPRNLANHMDPTPSRTRMMRSENFCWALLSFSIILGTIAVWRSMRLSCRRSRSMVHFELRQSMTASPGLLIQEEIFWKRLIATRCVVGEIPFDGALSSHSSGSKVALVHLRKTRARRDWPFA